MKLKTVNKIIQKITIKLKSNFKKTSQYTVLKTRSQLLINTKKKQLIQVSHNTSTYGGMS